MSYEVWNMKTAIITLLGVLLLMGSAMASPYLTSSTQETTVSLQIHQEKKVLFEYDERVKVKEQVPNDAPDNPKAPHPSDGGRGCKQWVEIYEPIPTPKCISWKSNDDDLFWMLHNFLKR